MAAVRKLADNQLQTFSHRDYVTDSLFDGIAQRAAADFRDGNFSFLDVGGGPGLFTDRLLERFPKSRGAVLDNSELLLAENTSNARKQLVLASATDMV
ncbi:MAG TPA: class I SAM-dependent methyltransferase, partial [Candidatus Cybelea sp.]|nr:class I SAM-dependent methyltransferase [Candidatus Cybelea sp.]